MRRLALVCLLCFINCTSCFKKVDEQELQECVPFSSNLLTAVETPRGATVPRNLVPLLSTPASSFLGNDTCLVLLGDSTLTETAQDMQLFLELNQEPARCPLATTTATSTNPIFNFSNWVHKMSNTFPRTGKEVTYQYPHSNITFHTLNRLFYIEAAGLSIYFRFIGHSNLRKNNMGLATLNDAKVRKAILHGINRLCGTKKKVLLLQSGYHDAAASSAHYPVSREVVDTALTWLQQDVLAAGEKAYFLARQVGAVAEGGPRERMQSLFDHVRDFMTQQEKSEAYRGVWHFVDCRAAFICHQPHRESFGLGGHVGAIARGYINTSFPHYYLSVLQTAHTLQATFFGH